MDPIIIILYYPVFLQSSRFQCEKGLKKGSPKNMKTNKKLKYIIITNKIHTFHTSLELWKQIVHHRAKQK